MSKRASKNNFSLNKFFVYLPLLLIFLYYFHPIPLQGSNVDLGHHLVMGKIIVNEKFIPSTNIFSYVAQGFSVIDTSWLSQVIFYFWHKQFGYNGLIVLSVLLIILTYVFMYKNIEIKNKFLSTIIISLVYFQVFVERTEVKPELFSLLFLSIFLFILYKYKSAFTKLIFLLPILELLWVNIHIYFIVGPVVAMLFLIDEYFVKQNKIKSKKFLTLACITFVTFLAMLANPHFFKGAVYPLTVFSNYGYKVTENLNFFTAFTTKESMSFIYFIIAVMILWGSVIVSLKKVRRVDILLVCFFTILGFFAVRNFHLFVLGTFVPAVKGLDYILVTLSQKYSKKRNVIIRRCFLFTTFLIIFPSMIWTVSVHGMGLGVIDDAKDAVKLLQDNSLSGAVYNNYNIGNYLNYRFYPEEKVFVHGSPEAYPKEFFEKVYYPSEVSFDSFIQASKQYNFNIIFYEHKNQTKNENPLLYHLTKSDDWKMVYLNSSIVVFLKNIPANQKVIKAYSITEKKLRLSETELSDKNKIGDLSNFFRVIKWYDKMFEMDMKYLSFDPNNCTALRHVAVILNQKNDPREITYANRFFEECPQK